MHIAQLLIDRRIEGKNPDGHACHMLLPVAMKEGIRAEVIQCCFLNDGAGCSLMKISNNDSGYSDEDIVKTHQTLMGECTVVKSGKDQYLATVMNNNCRLASILSESGCFLTSATHRDSYMVTWTVLAPNSTYITNLVERMRGEGYGVSKISSTIMDTDILLTTKQEQVIEYAYLNGYYDTPKKININELCEHFSCTKSTLSVILKSAEKKIIGTYLNVNRNNNYY